MNYTIIAADVQEIFTATSDFRLIPGQDRLSLVARILDSLSQVVKGFDYTCSIYICPSDAAICNEAAALLAPAYISMDHASGLFSATNVPIVCPVDGGNLRVQVSLVSQYSVQVWFAVTCMPCRAGQAKTLDPSRRAWWCTSCGPKQYIIKPNDPSFGCKVQFFNFIPAMSFAGILTKKHPCRTVPLEPGVMEIQSKALSTVQSGYRTCKRAITYSFRARRGMRSQPRALLTDPSFTWLRHAYPAPLHDTALVEKPRAHLVWRVRFHPQAQQRRQETAHLPRLCVLPYSWRQQRRILTSQSFFKRLPLQHRSLLILSCWLGGL